jgi:hypothetical protein
LGHRRSEMRQPVITPELIGPYPLFPTLTPILEKRLTVRVRLPISDQDWVPVVGARRRQIARFTSWADKREVSTRCDSRIAGTFAESRESSELS